MIHTPNASSAASSLNAATGVQPAVRTGMAWQLTGAAVLALVLFYGVSFAHSPLAHNAAHDVRHITVKPCH